MNITSAQYINGINSDGSSDGENAVIKATIDSIEMSVPLDPDNRHYAEIMRQVEAGELVIAEAE